MSDLLLASGSTHRAQLLKNVGLAFRQEPSTLDERAIESPLDDADVLPEDRAEILAEAKALDVSEKNMGSWVIGCDQILAFENQVLRDDVFYCFQAKHTICIRRLFWSKTVQQFGAM